MKRNETNNNIYYIFIYDTLYTFFPTIINHEYKGFHSTYLI